MPSTVEEIEAVTEDAEIERLRKKQGERLVSAIEAAYQAEGVDARVNLSPGVRDALARGIANAVPWRDGPPPPDERPTLPEALPSDPETKVTPYRDGACALCGQALANRPPPRFQSPRARVVMAFAAALPAIGAGLCIGSSAMTAAAVGGALMLAIVRAFPFLLRP